MKLLWNEEDITQEIDITGLLYGDYAGGHADKVFLKCLNVNHLAFAKKDVLKVEKDGINTGNLYISEISKKGDIYTMKALSTKTKQLDSNVFIKDRITLYELAEQAAKDLGCTLVMKEVQNQLYDYKEQILVDKIKFLTHICELEGILIKINHDRLILMNEKAVENMDSVLELEEEDFIQTPEFLTKDSGLLSCVENSYYYKNMHFQATVYSNRPGKKLVVRHMCDSMNECQRICKNIMRNANKNEFTGSGIILNQGLQAADNIMIHTDGIFAGKYFIFKVVHDLINETQKLYFRKPIEGDY